jgi:addiction module RelE/StbE family toxin
MQIEWLPSALRDLERLREFLRPKNPGAAQKAVTKIKKAVSTLKVHPALGIEVEDLPGFYDVPITFGVRNYVLRYRIHGEIIYIVALRHGRESGFSDEK